MTEVYFFYLDIICHNKMMFVNCAVEENKLIPGVLDPGANMNGISHKYISELGIMYHSAWHILALLIYQNY